MKEKDMKKIAEMTAEELTRSWAEKRNKKTDDMTALKDDEDEWEDFDEDEDEEPGEGQLMTFSVFGEVRWI